MVWRSWAKNHEKLLSLGMDLTGFIDSDGQGLGSQALARDAAH